MKTITVYGHTFDIAIGQVYRYLHDTYDPRPWQVKLVKVEFDTRFNGDPTGYTFSYSE